MSFWNAASFEPKRQHRFLVTLPLLTQAKQYLAKAVGKPGFEISTTEHKFLGNTYYYPGTVTWSTIEMTMVNAVDPDGNDTFMTALSDMGWLQPAEQQTALGAGKVGTVNKQAATTKLGEVTIQELSGQGDVVGTWTLKGSFITSVAFGDLDYNGDDILNITIGLRYDWAEYATSAGAGAGAPTPPAG